MGFDGVRRKRSGTVRFTAARDRLALRLPVLFVIDRFEVDELISKPIAGQLHAWERPVPDLIDTRPRVVPNVLN